MHLEVEGDGVEIIKETPNQLIIDGISGIWTITFKRG
jgi:adenosylmethionine-8-amino-7-oxononanoate aminotransferase